MAKPINPYQGPAPAAMAQMGAGILEAGVAAGSNAARMIQGGYESMGKGIASGIGAAADAYKQYKEDQAKFDATKKMVKAYESYLPKKKDPETGKEFSPMLNDINSFLNDTTISTREKIAMTPMVMGLLGNAQQQYGRENIANIMAGNRLDVAALKNPAPATRPAFNAAPEVDPLDQVVGQAPAAPAPAATAPYMIQRPQGQPQPTQGPLSNMPKTRQDPKTGRMQFWSPGAKRYIDESENDLIFGPDFRIQ